MFNYKSMISKKDPNPNKTTKSSPRKSPNEEAKTPSAKTPSAKTPSAKTPSEKTPSAKTAGTKKLSYLKNPSNLLFKSRNLNLISAVRRSTQSGAKHHTISPKVTKKASTTSHIRKTSLNRKLPAEVKKKNEEKEESKKISSVTEDAINTKNTLPVYLDGKSEITIPIRKSVVPQLDMSQINKNPIGHTFSIVSPYILDNKSYRHNSFSLHKQEDSLLLSSGTFYNQPSNIRISERSTRTQQVVLGLRQVLKYAYKSKKPTSYIGSFKECNETENILEYGIFLRPEQNPWLPYKPIPKLKSIEQSIAPSNIPVYNKNPLYIRQESNEDMQKTNTSLDIYPKASNVRSAQGSIISPTAKLLGDHPIIIGSSCIINPGAIIIAESGKIQIGNQNFLNEKVKIHNRSETAISIGTENYIGVGTEIYDGAQIGNQNLIDIHCKIIGPSSVGSNCILKPRSFIKPGDCLNDNLCICGEMHTQIDGISGENQMKEPHAALMRQIFEMHMANLKLRN